VDVQQEFNRRERALTRRLDDLIRRNPPAWREYGKLLDVGRRFPRDESFYDAIGRLVAEILRDRPDYSADAGVADARRVLLVFWILTERGSLRTRPPITRFQFWDWGTWPGFLHAEGKHVNITSTANRQYAYERYVEPHRVRWTNLVEDALDFLGHAESDGKENRGGGARDHVRVGAQAGDNQSERAAPHDKADRAEEILSERERNFLEALLRLGAFASDARRTTEEVVAVVHKGADPNSYKKVASQLQTRGYIETKRSRGGGCWLTSRGRARAERLAQA
jgi:hypothetical protein